MKKFLSLLFAVLLTGSAAADAQSFRLSVKPDTVFINQGESAEFSVKVIDVKDFDASVYLSVSSPSIEKYPSKLSISPPIVNTPYTAAAKVISKPASSLTDGIHAVVIKAENGALVHYDTCYVSITKLVKWTVYSTYPPIYNYLHSLARTKSGKFWIYSAPGFASPGSSAVMTMQDKKFTRETTPFKGFLGMVEDNKGKLWFGTGNELVSYDGQFWKTFDTTDVQGVGQLVMDSKGNIWMTSTTGALMYDGNSFTRYNSSNSEIGGDSVSSIAIDRNDTVWVISQKAGAFYLSKFNGSQWQNFPVAGLLDTYPRYAAKKANSRIGKIGLDSNGTVWFLLNEYFDKSYMYHKSAYKALGSFDGSQWKVYDKADSSLPFNYIFYHAADNRNNIWVGSSLGPPQPTHDDAGEGLARFDGQDWTVYNKDNSGLPKNEVWSILIDEDGNKWLGTGGGGLAVFHEDGLKGILFSNPSPVNDKDIEESGFSVAPNPSNGRSAIKFRVESYSRVEISLHDYLGNTLSLLTDEELPEGEYSRNLDLSGLSPGSYYCKIAIGGTLSVQKIMLLK